MKLGPLVIPIHSLIFCLSLLAAFVVLRMVERPGARTERAFWWILAVGLITARLVFVLRYLPAYAERVETIFDIRDLGFDALAGVVSAACVATVFLLRSRAIRKPLAAGIAAGVLAWGVATAAADSSGAVQTMPAISLANVSGGVEPLSGGDGKPTIVNLWATWCPPCQAEMPVLAQAQSENPGIHLVFVNQGETRQNVAEYVEAHGMRLQHSLLDPSLQVARAVGAVGYPTTLFYDANGRLLDVHLGSFSKATLQLAMEKFYASAQTPP